MVTMTEQQQHFISDDVVPGSSEETKSLLSTSNKDSCTTHQFAMKQGGKLILESEKPVLPGIHIKAASLDTLVELCINCCDPINGYLNDESNLPRVLFLMHKWFTTSDELANHFIRFYQRADKLKSCDAYCDHHQSQKTSCSIYQYRSQVCHCLRYWINCFPIHFDSDVKLAATMRDFQLHLRETYYVHLSDMVDISCVPSYEWMRKMSLRTSVRKHSRKVSLVFNHLEADELADHITYLEHKVMRRISFPEFKRYAVEGTPKDIPKLERSIALFNGLSQWVQCMVLSKTSPHQRADIVVKFVNISKRLREIQNFNSLMAVVGGLSHSSLARLTKTMACVPTESLNTLKEMTELLASTSNFGNYRKALNESVGFKIPILGVHMKDLISLQVALPDSSNKNGDMINFRKIALLSIIFDELAEMQNSTPPIEANIDLVNTLRLSLDLVHTEDEIYDLSLQREPKSSSSSSPTKPSVMFADWAAGVNIVPDPVTIQKHTNAMIDAVFKHYDHDRDGYISKEEFQAISENFPSIDSFYVLDADQDGMISKNEMRDHYMRANCPALKTGFKHEFHETTYFKPTFCAHCTGLLWGIIKQGYKCRDCGINAHKHCKDLVVIQCRNRNSSCTSRSNSFAGADNMSSKTIFKTNRKKKISLNEDETCLLPKGVEYRTCKCDRETHTIVVTEHELSESQVSKIQNQLARIQNNDKVASTRKGFQSIKSTINNISSPTVNRKERPIVQSNNFLHPTANGSPAHHEKQRSLST